MTILEEGRKSLSRADVDATLHCLFVQKEEPRLNLPLALIYIFVSFVMKRAGYSSDSFVTPL